MFASGKLLRKAVRAGKARTMSPNELGFIIKIFSKSFIANASDHIPQTFSLGLSCELSEKGPALRRLKANKIAISREGPQVICSANTGYGDK